MMLNHRWTNISNEDGWLFVDDGLSVVYPVEDVEHGEGGREEAAGDTVDLVGAERVLLHVQHVANVTC